jgi:hypothetical protein
MGLGRWSSERPESREPAGRLEERPEANGNRCPWVEWEKIRGLTGEDPLPTEILACRRAGGRPGQQERIVGASLPLWRAKVADPLLRTNRGENRAFAPSL